MISSRRRNTHSGSTGDSAVRSTRPNTTSRAIPVPSTAKLAGEFQAQAAIAASS